eukprot:IDg19642t1
MSRALTKRYVRQLDQTAHCVINSNAEHIRKGRWSTGRTASVCCGGTACRARKRGLAAAANTLQPTPDFLFVDGNFILPAANIGTDRQRAVVAGDSSISVVAAAGIIAKVTRDELVSNELHSRFPDYGFDRHKGYATKLHLACLAELGPSDEHRFSYRPVREAREALAGAQEASADRINDS